MEIEHPEYDKPIPYFEKITKTAPLAVFRFLFGLLMFLSIIRFWAKGWIEKLYIEPSFHFHYLYFDFITVLGPYTYLLFIVCGLSALAVCLGFYYKAAITIFFLSFTYIELMDKTTYLNHYYFVSVISFILIWLPAHRSFSLDARFNPDIKSAHIPKWSIDCIKLFIAIVYIYAGIAKLNYDWLFEAKPLSIWLSSKSDFPIMGSYMHKTWLHYMFSWGGAIYDLAIPFLLYFQRTRLLAFILVVGFHLMTGLLFPIGMFPYIMIISALIFFSPEFHEKTIQFISRQLTFMKASTSAAKDKSPIVLSKISKYIIATTLIFQLLIPWRFLLYPGQLFWTEQGYRFSWRVMLMEKTGYANFKIVDGKTQKRFYVQNEDFLTAVQQKQMSTQADLIVEYAHYLGKHFTQQGHQNVEVYVESYVSLHGSPSKLYIDPTLNLLTVSNSLKHKSYILSPDE